MMSEMPSGGRDDLSADAVDATVFVVRLFANGEWVTLCVDGRVPVGKDGSPLYASHAE